MKSSMFRFLAASALLGGAPVFARHRLDCYDIAGSIASLVPYSANFTGSLVLPSDPGYNNSVWQYASPTYASRMTPSVIVYAQSETDVQAAVMFAAECGYRVAARSGGHAYLGSSSCDSSVTPCMQIDVGSFKTRSLDGRLLTLGPGVLLFEVAEFSFVNEIFLPAGECSHVAVGGHVQTGGYGVWSRQLGPLAAHVDSFRIVLADGSAHQVITPIPGVTTKQNDDLFWVVRGGGAGNWGVVTEYTFVPYFASEVFNVYWLIGFIWDTDGCVNMYRTFGEIAIANMDNPYWTMQLSVAGDASTAPGLFNAIYLELGWFSPIEAAGEYDPTLFQTLVDSCTGCTMFLDLPDAVEPPAFTQSFKYIKTIEGISFPQFPSSLLEGIQGPMLPSADSSERVARFLDEHLPQPDSPYSMVAQFFTVLPHTDPDSRALPWPNDLAGWILNMFYPGPQDVEVQALVESINTAGVEIATEAFGANHQMFWGAFNPPVFPRDALLFFDDEAKYNRVVDIKGCVDPDGVFDSEVLSIPLPAKKPKSCKKAKGRKGKGKMKSMKSMKGY